VIKLRDLNLPPGATTTKTVDARIPCVPNSAGYTWKVEVKQSNDFSGTGNDFVLNPSTAMPLLDGAGLCKLEFAAGPTSAQRSSNITAVPYLTSGASVLVKVLDGSQKPSAPVTWWPNDVTLALAANPALGSLGAPSAFVRDSTALHGSRTTARARTSRRARSATP